MDKIKNLIISLLECNVFGIGNFKLKSGALTPIYIDLRKIIHYPQVVKDLAAAIRAKQIEKNLKIDKVCGVPYTALPIASVYSVLYNVPMVMKRKEAKDYGTKRTVEGNFQIGDSCLIIEDIVASGTSIMETLEALREEGLNVHDCVVVVNKNQGGIENLKKVGLTLHPLFDIDSIFNAYCTFNRVEAELAHKIATYFKKNPYFPILKKETDSTTSYIQRAKNSNHPVAKRLLEIMDGKKTNLCVSIDTTDYHELIKLTEQLGPYICLLKTHIDLLHDFSEDFVTNLSKLSAKHNFLILEDRTFAETGNIVMHQYKNGLYKIQKWADLVTAIPGTGTIEALKISSKHDKNACILASDMMNGAVTASSNYREQAFNIADSNSDFVIGYMAQQRYLKGKNLICMCPGINILPDGFLGSKYKLPEDAIANGADIIIVGESICKAVNIVASAIEYKTRSFNAYLNRIS